MASEFATRISGSSDLYEWSGRRPHASVNFITCHDGFTLNDLVSYDHKHNEANGEENRDGANDNNSWNCGVEGPTDDPQIIELREKKKRAFLATLIFSQGIPMLLAGDEISHTQTRQQQRLLSGQRNHLAQLETRRPPKRSLGVRSAPDRHLSRRADAASSPVFPRQIAAWRPVARNRWLDPSGNEMSGDDWTAGHVRCLGVHLVGGHIDVDEYGTPIIGDHLLILFNADHEQEISFVLPKLSDECGAWERLFDTALDGWKEEEREGRDEGVDNPYKLSACSMAVFRRKCRAEWQS